MRWLLAALLLTTCAPVQQPDEQRGFEVIYWQGHPRLPHALDALDVIQQHALALHCKGLGWCAQVYFTDSPIDCGGYPVNGGCQPDQGSCAVVVAWRPTLADTALADELGHYAWEACYGRTGEHLEGQERVYDPDFRAWVDAVDADLRQRSM